jgi:hypothetical protein
MRIADQQFSKIFAESRIETLRGGARRRPARARRRLIRAN